MVRRRNELFYNAIFHIIFLLNSTCILLFYVSCSPFINATAISSSKLDSNIIHSQSTLTLSEPNQTIVKSGPVTYEISYSEETVSESISLSSNDVVITGTGSNDCEVTEISGSGLSREVTIDHCTGTGIVSISILAGTSTSNTGLVAAASESSAPFYTDNLGPSATNVSISGIFFNPSGYGYQQVWTSTDTTPVINYDSVSDVGYSTVDSYQVKIVRTIDEHIIQDWIDHTSGQSVVTSELMDIGVEYSIYVRAIDQLGNTGETSVRLDWSIIMFDF